MASWVVFRLVFCGLTVIRHTTLGTLGFAVTYSELSNLSLTKLFDLLKASFCLFIANRVKKDLGCIVLFL